MHPYLNIAIKAARLAGKIIVDASLHPDSFKVARKPSSSPTYLDLVTSVDQACEEAIIKTIFRAYPDHNIQAEESDNQDNGSNITWIIDPLDGTFNFVHALPFFAVSIAVLDGDHIEHGVVYNPISDELFTATRGSGAKLNNKRIRCSQNNKLSEALVAIETGLLIENCSNNKKLLEIEKKLPFSVIRYMGSAAMHLAFVAAGRVDGYVEVGLKPWDIAAGALLVREAGGYVTDLNGKDQFLSTGEIVAGNPKIHRSLQELSWL